VTWHGEPELMKMMMIYGGLRSSEEEVGSINAANGCELKL